MAMAAALMVGLAAIVLYFLGVLVAWAVVQISPSRRSTVKDVFE